MPATEEITFTISKDIADLIRSKVASGEYASASEYVLAALTSAFDFPDSHDPKLDHWLKSEGVARYDAYDANPDDVYTADEVRQAVESRLADRQKPA